MRRIAEIRSMQGAVKRPLLPPPEGRITSAQRKVSAAIQQALERHTHCAGKRECSGDDLFLRPWRGRRRNLAKSGLVFRRHHLRERWPGVSTAC